jgi:aconitate hydratase 2/2-methylisocitrate dehydratase
VEQGIVPQTLSAEQINDLVELLKAPPADEEDFLLDLLGNRIPAGIDDAAVCQVSTLSLTVRIALLMTLRST